MILDEFGNRDRYRDLLPGLAVGLDFLARADSISVGRHEIDGARVVGQVAEYRTRPLESLRFESHEAHVDIQAVVFGRESVLWSPRSGLAVEEAYSAERDIAFHARLVAAQSIALTPGLFAIFFPEDAHAPGGVFDAPCDVRKIVIKVAISRNAN